MSLRTKSLPFVGAFLFLEILPYKNKIGNAEVNLLSMSALLLAQKYFLEIEYLSFLVCMYEFAVLLL